MVQKLKTSAQKDSISQEPMQHLFYLTHYTVWARWVKFSCLTVSYLEMLWNLKSDVILEKTERTFKQHN